MTELTHYTNLLQAIKQRIREAQTRAIVSVNAELIQLYWDIGQLISQRQQQAGWSAGVIPKLALDLNNELPEGKAFRSGISGAWSPFFVPILPQNHFCHKLWQKVTRAHNYHTKSWNLRLPICFGASLGDTTLCSLKKSKITRRVAGTCNRPWPRAGAATRWQP